MLSVYLYDGPESVRIRLVGELASADVGGVEATWVTARSATRGRKVVFDLSELRGADSRGRGFLQEAAATGALFVTATPEGEASVETIPRIGMRVLPPPRLTAWAFVRCWWGRAFRVVQPSIRRCIACGCAVRKIWEPGG